MDLQSFLMGLIGKQAWDRYGKEPTKDILNKGFSSAEDTLSSFNQSLGDPISSLSNFFSSLSGETQVAPTQISPIQGDIIFRDNPLLGKNISNQITKNNSIAKAGTGWDENFWLGGKDAEGMSHAGVIPVGLQAMQGLYGMYSGNKALGMAKDQFNFQKKAYQNNYNMQKQQLETARADRAERMASAAS